MNRWHNDIKDDEIRVISSDVSSGMNAIGKRRKIRTVVWLVTAVFVIAAGALFYEVLSTGDDKDDEEHVVVEENAGTLKLVTNNNAGKAERKKGYVEKTDTTVNKIPLVVFTPRFATARLQRGIETLRDTAAVLVLQAADVRKDNGEIVGAYVSEGNLISKGQAKSGFCAIIGGTPVIGVSDATPYLEQAIETNGYFFRQYPLVVGGQVVENKPKGKAIRRALAELDGETAVVISKVRITFHEFSQALVDIGVSNAIYLVGSGTYGTAVDSSGKRIKFGKEVATTSPNINYIVWE